MTTFAPSPVIRVFSYPAISQIAANALVVLTPHDRALARAERMERVATLRIAPEPANEEAAAERAVDDAEDNSRTSRSGRAIRRPAQLSL